MSLWINIDAVERVLIAGRWYDVLNQSFDTDAYEFVQHWWNGVWKHRSYQLESMCTGYCFLTEIDGKEQYIKGPLQAIQAIIENEGLHDRKVKEQKLKEGRNDNANS